MDKFYQACYTRLGGTERDAGWQLTNLSPDIPSRLLRFFEQRQKGNAPVGRDTPCNVKGEHLCAMEIGCEGDAFGITRVQYGVPCHGREGLYSHGFFIPDAYELLKEPNRLLALSGENFCFRGERPAPEEELDVYQQRTAEIPQSLSYEEGWDVERALERTGMNGESYRTYLYCLYSCWAKSAKTTFYVKTDGTEEMAKAMLYLAYVAVPYSMRTKLSASTFLDAKDVTMVLSHEKPDSSRWFDPGTGMENMLSDIQRRRWEKMPVVTMAFEEGCGFEQLEAKLEQLGDRGSQDLDVLKLAYTLCQGGEDRDSVDMLYDFLELPLNFNEMMEHMVGDMLSDVIRRVEHENLGVSNDMEDMLIQRQKNSTSEEFKDAIRYYRSIRLVKMDVQEASDYLEKEEDFFREMRPDLAKKGLEVLLEYYRRKLQKTIDDPTCTYKNLTDCAMEFRDLQSMGVLWNMICEKAKSIASEQIKAAQQKMGTDKALTGEHTELYLALEAYVEFGKRMKELLETVPQGEVFLADLRNDYAVKAKECIQKYDRELRSRFNKDRIREYEVFYNQDFRGMDTLCFGRELLRVYREAEYGNLQLLWDYAEHKPDDVSYIDWGAIRKPLFEYWCDSLAVRQNAWMKAEIDAVKEDPSEENIRKFVEKDSRTLNFWAVAAIQKGQETIRLMLDKESAIVRVKGKLEMSLAYNEKYWDEDMMCSWYDECTKCMKAGMEGARPIRDLLARKLAEITAQAELEEKAQAAAEKQAAKEQEKAEKQAARERKKGEKQAAKEQEKAEKQAARERADALRKAIVEDGFADQTQPQNGVPEGHVSWEAVKQEPLDVDDTDSALTVMQIGQNHWEQNKDAYVDSRGITADPVKTEKKGLKDKLNFKNWFKR